MMKAYRSRWVRFLSLVGMWVIATAWGETGETPSDTARLSTSEILARQMAAVRDRDMSSHPEDWKVLFERPGEVLPCLQLYFDDPSSRVRREAVGKYGALASRVQDAEQRRHCVETLVAELATLTERADLSEEDFGMWSEIAKWLTMFASADFTELSRTAVLGECQKAVEHREWRKDKRVRPILLSGVAGLDLARPLLSAVVEEERESVPLSAGDWFCSLTWNAMRASARIYESEDIQKCIDTVRQQDPDPYRVLVSYGEQISYICRPEIMEFLLPFVNSDTSVPAEGCQPPDSLARRAIILIANMIPEMEAEVSAREAEVRAQLGRPLQEEEMNGLYREWINNRDNWSKMRR